MWESACYSEAWRSSCRRWCRSPCNSSAVFTPLALYTLGAGIAAQKIIRFEAGPQLLILFLKFLFAPIVSWMICRVMGLPDDETAVLVVAASTPVGVLITIFVAEYKTESRVHVHCGCRVDCIVADFRHRLDAGGAAALTQPLPAAFPAIAPTQSPV